MQEQYWIPIALLLASGFSTFRFVTRKTKAAFVYAIILFVAAIGSFLWMWSER